MAFPPFPNDALDLSDDDLGRLLLDHFIASQAHKLRCPIDNIPGEFRALVVEYIKSLESTTAKDAALQNALHKAASGDFKIAGKLLREHMMHGAVFFKYVPIGVNRSKQAASFGKKGGDQNRKVGEKNRKAIRKTRDEILLERKRKPSGRELAKLIAKKTGINYETVRGHLQRERKE